MWLASVVENDRDARTKLGQSWSQRRVGVFAVVRVPRFFRERFVALCRTPPIVHVILIRVHCHIPPALVVDGAPQRVRAAHTLISR
jgi:hypothetical protein